MSTKCVLCLCKLETGGFLRMAGTPITYARTYYCDNNECPRYGLVSVYKAADPNKENQ